MKTRYGVRWNKLQKFWTVVMGNRGFQIELASYPTKSIAMMVARNYQEGY